MISLYSLLIFFLGYFLGSVPFGLVLCLLFGHGDIRKIGSGSIGATNVLRTGNKFLAFMTVLLDGGKGAIAVLVALMVTGDQMTASLAALGAIIGHCFPVWLKFKGGKGVATTLGTILALSPILGFTLCGLWLVTALTTRISSLSALTAIALSPFVAYFIAQNFLLPGLCVLIAIVVFYKHKDNIKRLINGEEPKISFKKKEKKAPDDPDASSASQ